MRASDATPQPAAAAGTLAGALRDRNVWQLFVLGLGIGLPAVWTWYRLLRGMDAAVDYVLPIPLTAIGLIAIATLLAAPFLDRHRAPLFRALGHRRSWVASALAAVLVLHVLMAAAALMPLGVAGPAYLICAILALPLVLLLWISLDALRIEVVPGRAQAVAFGAQYLGALASAAIAAQLESSAVVLLPAAVTAVLLALALAATFLIDEPQPLDRSGAAGAGIAGTLTRPWSTFFAQHGAAAGLVLAAVALYALGASGAEYLGRQGYLVDILSADRSGAPAIRAARQPMTQLELVFSLAGALAGIAAAYRLAPARAFMVLQCAVLGLVAFFLVCRLALGFTVISVALLFALRTLVAAAATVMFGVIAARLMAPPHTAGQFALLGVFAALFWIGEAAMNRLAPMLGSLGTAAAASVCALLAIASLHLAGRAARRRD